MSKPSRRPAREELKQRKRERKRAQRALRLQEKVQGVLAPPQVSIMNATCPYESVEEERTAREDLTVEQVKVFRAQLPTILNRLAKIKDPRDPKKLKHKLSLLLLYGILTFVYHMGSRREANTRLTRPMFEENLKLLFPELESIPHHDTLNRVLSKIDVNEIEAAHLDVLRRLIANKSFRRYLVAHCYPIAIDGSQKLVRGRQWCEETLPREVKRGDGTALQHYVYVLEANLAFHNGMTIPLMSEFLNYADGDVARNKQDCEQRAFHRLANRLKRAFSHLPIMVLLDGLYPNGPITAHCRKLNWDFMIVLQDGSLPAVWEEAQALLKLEDHHHDRRWQHRQQHFYWVNDIEHRYGPNGRHQQKLHLVVCEETWQEVGENGVDLITKTSRHAWLSSRPLHAGNVHERCNLGARHRWSGIEASFLVEKHQGYQYEHCFAHDWNAMKGYHLLMRLAHMCNALAQHASKLVGLVRKMGVRAFIHFVVETIAGPWLNAQTVIDRLSAPFLLRR